MNPTTPAQSDNGFTNYLQHVKDLANNLKGKPNPNQLVQTMLAQENPQLAQGLNVLSGQGMSAKQMFLMAAQQKGIDPTQIVNALK
jgi:hypothetical protein